jgi:hypothetical protein
MFQKLQVFVMCNVEKKRQYISYIGNMYMSYGTIYF